ncbi:hypothetical protein K469DRAFT_714786 [Zopfia rhizophila CBS 207.26]|uniref:Peptidase A1 domain-containing protein n=1 Tax=Zopfia rhizophila CBS 207.26 TaxID=1314779 RepID=A0A6A6DMW4_9PEZI|nr:hypothetical protein K469DRAFT_714786 [Zopfia rhizophila CBS 207.26]
MRFPVAFHRPHFTFYRIFIIASEPLSAFPASKIIVNAAKPPVYLVMTGANNDDVLNLGTTSNLTASANGTADTDVQTVPFDINVGTKDVLSGSITLSGYYDANRINATSWIPLPKSKDSPFLNNGITQFNIHVYNKDSKTNTNTTRTATLDFNNDTIVVPSSYPCSKLTVQPFDAVPLYPITISGYLLTNKSRCYQREKDDSSAQKGSIMLCKPFFQAAYVYVERDGQVYLTQANDYDLPSKPEKFDAKAEIQAPKQPEGYKILSSAGMLSSNSWTVSFVVGLIGIWFLW